MQLRTQKQNRQHFLSNQGTLKPWHYLTQKQFPQRGTAVTRPNKATGCVIKMSYKHKGQT